MHYTDGTNDVDGDWDIYMRYMTPGANSGASSLLLGSSDGGVDDGTITDITFRNSAVMPGGGMTNVPTGVLGN